MAGQRARDQLELRMPRLARVDEETAGSDGVGRPAMTGAQKCCRAQFVETRYDAKRGPRRQRAETRAIESIAVRETRDAGETPFADERGSLLDIARAVIAQEDGCGPHARGVQRLEHVTSVACRDVHHVNRHSGARQTLHGVANQFFDVDLSLTDSAPTN